MSEEQAVEQTPEQVAVEKEARALGWVPQTEFRDGDHFVDAETFVRRGKEINPILRKNNEILLKKLDTANAEIAEVRKVAKEFEKFQKENAERKVAELTQELSALKEQKKTAVTQGDGDAVVAIDDAIDAVKEQQRIAKEQPKELPKEEPKKKNTDPEFDIVITSWMDENNWFGQDIKLTKMADAIGEELNATRPDLKGKAFFEALDKELEDILPEKYQKPTKRQSPVEGGTTSGTRRPTVAKKSYENLPSDARAACDKFVKSGLMTKEAYVQEYDWE